MFGKLKCLFGFHEWNMFRGYNEAPHHTAYCIRCGMRYHGR